MSDASTDWVDSASTSRSRMWRANAVEARDAWLAQNGPKLDFFVGSFGGVASSSLAWFLTYQGVITNPPDDEACIKHVNSPAHPLLEPFEIQTFVYVVGDPVLAVASIFRRGLAELHSPKLTDGEFMIQPGVTLDEYAHLEVDMFDFESHVENWCEGHLATVIVANDVTNPANAQAVLDELKLGHLWPERQAARERSSTRSKIGDASLALLEATYGGLHEKLLAFPPCSRVDAS